MQHNIYHYILLFLLVLVYFHLLPSFNTTPPMPYLSFFTIYVYIKGIKYLIFKYLTLNCSL